MIDFTHTSSANYHKERIKKKIYKNVNQAAKNTQWIRLSGLGIGVASGAIEVAFNVAYLGETIIKGFGNIIGHLFTTKCDAKKGLKQLCKELPLAAFIVAITPIYITAGVVITTVGILIKPQSYTEDRINMHNDLRRKAKDKIYG